uniref:Uncharacterized protein LOC104232114 n=1 Tax=Nicotiana sylvestris TaxID=4096 RepID=A0A1U7WUD4_NICSY|nr:PREDICTED: uncharacterized protein LOC104232114 [Nicotiana sylvestris]
MSKNGFNKHVEPKEAPRLSEYNFSIDASGIVSAIRRIKDTRWPRPLQTDLAQRNPNQMCKYRGTHGHKTKQTIKGGGSLDRDTNRKNEQEELQHVIHMIVSGVDIPQGPTFKCTKVTITREKRTRDYLPEDTLSFNEEEAEGIEQPHNDALIISIIINKIQVKYVLVDPGSSSNIIRSRVVGKLGLQDQIVPATRVLNDFNVAGETTKGKIMLPVNVAGTIQETKFHMIE